MGNLYAMNTGHDCTICSHKQDGFLCHLSPAAMKEFITIRRFVNYPAGTVLFLENEDPHGIFLMCSGQIKLSISSSGGKTLVLRIAKLGDILGLTATMGERPYEATAEVLQPCQAAFIRKEDFLRFLNHFPEAYGAVVKQLGTNYTNACEQLRTIGLSTSAHEKLARLLLHWSSDGVETTEGTQIRVPWTHEQIAECVGSTRETVSRTLSEFKHKRLVTVRGATMMIPNRAALQAVGGF